MQSPCLKLARMATCRTVKFAAAAYDPVATGRRTIRSKAKDREFRYFACSRWHWQGEEIWYKLREYLQFPGGNMKTLCAAFGLLIFSGSTAAFAQENLGEVGEDQLVEQGVLKFLKRTVVDPLGKVACAAAGGISNSIIGADLPEEVGICPKRRVDQDTEISVWQLLPESLFIQGNYSYSFTGVQCAQARFATKAVSFAADPSKLNPTSYASYQEAYLRDCGVPLSDAAENVVASSVSSASATESRPSEDGSDGEEKRELRPQLEFLILAVGEDNTEDASAAKTLSVGTPLTRYAAGEGFASVLSVNTTGYLEVWSIDNNSTTFLEGVAIKTGPGASQLPNKDQGYYRFDTSSGRDRFQFNFLPCRYASEQGASIAQDLEVASLVEDKKSLIEELAGELPACPDFNPDEAHPSAFSDATFEPSIFDQYRQQYVVQSSSQVGAFTTEIELLRR